MSLFPDSEAEEAEFYRQKRIRDIAEWGVTRRVPCPVCGAKVGEDCHSEPGWYPNPNGHAVRRRNARMVCTAVIYHGPGHQSRSECEAPPGPHTTHYATLFGEHVGVYEWEWHSAFAEWGGGVHENTHCGCPQCREARRDAESH